MGACPNCGMLGTGGAMCAACAGGQVFGNDLQKMNSTKQGYDSPPSNSRSSDVNLSEGLESLIVFAATAATIYFGIGYFEGELVPIGVSTVVVAATTIDLRKVLKWILILGVIGGIAYLVIQSQ